MRTRHTIPGTRFTPAARAASLVLLLTPLLLGCTPKVEKVRPRFRRIGWTGVDVDFQVQVRNRGLVPLRTPRFRAGLAVEGVEFLRTEVPVSHSLPARKTTTITLPTRVSYRRLWDAYQKLREANQAAYRLHGSLLFTLLGRELAVPLAHEGTFPVLRMPRFTTLSVHVARLSATQAELSVDVGVANPNVFPIDLRGVGYVLELGDQRIAGLLGSTPEPIGPGDTGRIRLTAELSASRTVLGLMDGARLRDARLCPTGVLKTPYGTARLDRAPRRSE